LRQKVLVLYLETPALDAKVVAWSLYDGTGATRPMAGDADEPPYASGLDALKAGWRLFQASQIADPPRGAELTLGYLRYEFFFEQLVEVTP
jgi:hypothetical protein